MPKLEQPQPKFQWRTALRVTVWGLGLAAVGFAAKEARSFLRSDPRFNSLPSTRFVNPGIAFGSTIIVGMRLKAAISNVGPDE